jgi:hypothetical protein
LLGRERPTFAEPRVEDCLAKLSARHDGIALAIDTKEHRRRRFRYVAGCAEQSCGASHPALRDGHI